MLSTIFSNTFDLFNPGMRPHNIRFLGDALEQPEVDHIGWSAATLEEYVSVSEVAEEAGAKKLIETMIRGRPITTFELAEPLKFVTSKDLHLGNFFSMLSEPPNEFRIRLLELTAPKPGRPTQSGWDHIEVLRT